MGLSHRLLLGLILVPFLGFLFSLTAQNNNRNTTHNVLNVAVFAIVCNILLLWRIFTDIDLSKSGIQLLEKYQWLNIPRIELALGIDVLSIILILAIHLMLLISIPFVKNTAHPKILGSMSLLMLSMFTGFFISADIFSFYIFFTAILVPLFMLIGVVGEVKKQSWMFRFFIYNFIGSILLFIVVCILYHLQNQEQSILLGQVARIRMKHTTEYFVWGGIFIALLSRIPIWPFHYWIASINGAIQNPLVFLSVNLIPLTGVYGLIRFCPKAVPESVGYFLTSLEIIAAISMLFIAMIGLINKDSRYKLFSFITVYYIIYLLGALLPTSRIMQNIGYSLFALLIIITVLEVLSFYIQREQNQNHLTLYGVLCNAPRLSLLYSFFTLAAVGFPLSALFINNFVILSYLFNYNFNLGLVIMFAIIVSSASLLKELYIFKDNRYIHPNSTCIMDISRRALLGLGIIMIMVLLSFFNPLLVLGVQ